MKFFQILLLSLFCHLLPAQSIEEGLYHRARIDLTSQSIQQLERLGIETDHGIHQKGRSLESDFSASELVRIREAGFAFEILIYDVVSYYQQPDRERQLHQNFNRDKNCGQTEKCTIGQYQTPVYYSRGSMGGYKTYSETLRALDSMKMLFPHLITDRIDIDSDTTHMGHKIFYLKISDQPDAQEDESRILYTALHHAREPNSLDQMLFFMWYLLENYEEDEEVRFLVDNNELYFIPFVNPDGYQLNEMNNPNGGGLWRKNAWLNDNDVVTGVDLNRNYGYFWGFDNQGSSANPNSTTYRGPSAFSEPETRAVKKLCEDVVFTIALNYHTSGDLLIHPWGYNDEPTDEDDVFKGLGNKMIEENCYTMGTGTETVGYVVNGDSDDWMYGEELSKQKIYSFTPEVGYAFWPAIDDIEDLSRGCLAMNLNAAKLTSNLHEVRVESMDVVSDTDNTLTLIVSKSGLGTGEVMLVVETVSPNLVGSEVRYPIELNIGESDTVSYTLDFLPGIDDGENVQIKVSIEGSPYRTESLFTFQYFNAPVTVPYTNSLEEITGWETTVDWAITNEYAYEGNSSLADSPFSRYRRNTVSSATMTEPLDLSSAAYAELRFHARWAIENDYDYVMLQASTDGVNYEALCGNYTNPGSNDQEAGEPLYDGFQTDWVSEVSPLNDFLGEPTVYLRFLLVSDGFVEEEGMYIDNISLNVIEKPVSNVEDPEYFGRIFPNPAGDYLTIQTADALVKYTLYNAAGQPVCNGVTDGRIDVSKINAGFYILRLDHRQGFVTHRFVKE